MSSVVVIETPGNPDLETPGNPASSLPFQLYFKIIKVIGLEAPGGEKAKSFVEFSFERDGVVKERGRTRVFKLGVEPSWNEEWVMGRVRGGVESRRMRFCVYEHHWLRPNELIGEVVVDLNGMKTGESVEKVLELREREVLEKGVEGEEMVNMQKGKLKGKLVVLIERSDLEEEEVERMKKDEEKKVIFHRLSSLRIVMEKLCYYPGETVRGMVVWNVGNEKKVRALRLHAVGESKCHWTESRGNNSDDHYNSKYSFFDMTSTLYGNGKKNGEGEEISVKSGNSFCFPFSFPLPLHLPSSFRAIYGDINYHITAFADRSMSLNKCARVDFQILSSFYSSIPSAMVLNAGEDTHSIISKNSLSIPFTISSPALINAGQSIPVSCSIDNSNPSSKPIKNIRISLIQHSTFYAAHVGSWKTKDIKRTIVSASLVPASNISPSKTLYSSSQTNSILEQSALPINPGQKRNFNVLLEIPALTPASIPHQLCPVISHSYYIEAEITTDGNYFTAASNTKQIAIVVSRPVAPPLFSSDFQPSLKIPGDCSMNINGKPITLEWNSYVPSVSQLSPTFHTPNPNTNMIDPSVSYPSQSIPSSFEEVKSQSTQNSSFSPQYPSNGTSSHSIQNPLISPPLDAKTLSTAPVMMASVVSKKKSAPSIIPWVIASFQSVQIKDGMNENGNDTKYDDLAVKYLINPRMLILSPLWSGIVPNPIMTIHHLAISNPMVHAIHHFNGNQNQGSFSSNGSSTVSPSTRPPLESSISSSLVDNSSIQKILQSISRNPSSFQQQSDESSYYSSETENQNGNSSFASSYSAPPPPPPPPTGPSSSEMVYVLPFLPPPTLDGLAGGFASSSIPHSSRTSISSSSNEYHHHQQQQYSSSSIALPPQISSSSPSIYSSSHQSTYQSKILSIDSFQLPSYPLPNNAPHPTVISDDPPSYQESIISLPPPPSLPPPYIPNPQPIPSTTLILTDTMITVWATSKDVPSFNPFLAPLPLTLSPSLLVPVLSTKLPKYSLLLFGGESVESLASDTEWVQISSGNDISPSSSSSQSYQTPM